MATTFSDLPKDVKWLIFRELVRLYLSPKVHYQYEVGYPVETSMMDSIVSRETRNFSLISRDCLKLVRSKCVRHRDGWFFIKGAITST